MCSCLSACRVYVLTFVFKKRKRYIKPRQREVWEASSWRRQRYIVWRRDVVAYMYQDKNNGRRDIVGYSLEWYFLACHVVYLWGHFLLQWKLVEPTFPIALASTIRLPHLEFFLMMSVPNQTFLQFAAWNAGLPDCPVCSCWCFHGCARLLNCQRHMDMHLCAVFADKQFKKAKTYGHQ